MITKFKLFEKLGINEDIEKLSNELIDAFKLNIKKGVNEFIFETNYLDQNITIICKYVKKLKENTQASFLTIDYKNRIFKIITTSLSKETFIHEIKHLDRKLKNPNDDFIYLSYIGRQLLDKYSFLVKSKYKNIIDYIIYWANPDEFEAYYHQYYYTLKKLTNKVDSNEEKRKIIDKFLSDKMMYNTYKEFSHNNFDLRVFFKSNRALNEYIDKYMKHYETLDKEKNIYYKWLNEDSFFSLYIKPLFNIFKKEKDLTEESKTFVKKFNKLINYNIMKNWKKFHRLYTLILDEKS
jgi:hypothetical protein